MTSLPLANALRMLSLDAVQKANSGHPGMPMGMADIATVLWREHLNHSPTHPHWPNRDRFILSNGHGSMLLYSLLHLTGYADMTIEQLKNFRQLHSITPGHPEFGLATGVETTTGPLGQGLANAVGMAIAERTLAAQFNQKDLSLVDHFTYAFVGDGCLMEGISHEAASLAGTLGLGKLIVFWDDNGISIDGKVEAWFSEDTAKRFEAYGWHVIPVIDGHDPVAVNRAIIEAKSVTDKPSFICCQTQIGFGSPNFANTAKAHGSALGEAEVALVREKLHWSYPPFVIPDEIYSAWDAKSAGEKRYHDWKNIEKQYQAKYPELHAELLRRLNKELPKDFVAKNIAYQQQVQASAQNIATRKSSQLFLNTFGPLLPELFGGSADLSESNLTFWHGAKAINHDNALGDYLFFGVREFGMAAILNGIALYGGFIPYGGTFLTFTDYMRNAMRLAAIMHQRVIFVLTHDSIGLGEDGPTHQPIEHATMLRVTPNVMVWRPCDEAETAVAWAQSIEHQNGPSCLLLSRQNVSPKMRDEKQLAAIARGGYILLDAKQPQLILLATGSEVDLALEVAKGLTEKGIHVRVVSMPCAERFDAQDTGYKESVLPSAIRCRVAIEAGSTAYWYKYVGLDGQVIGIDRFGESAPAKQVYEALGLSKENIIRQISKNLCQEIADTNVMGIF